eukprot:TRINITY_DN1570_c0_g1_i1.p1 TRINITY_DN1570_c0_g1~~TRINITY_DN1570_c0_g1_i1.p1  ORF type:complete len:185 (-),score=18.34 TRINITY_DN1570_c0_g1_i1:18-572(-)
MTKLWPTSITHLKNLFVLSCLLLYQHLTYYSFNFLACIKSIAAFFIQLIITFIKFSLVKSSSSSLFKMRSVSVVLFFLIATAGVASFERRLLSGGSSAQAFASATAVASGGGNAFASSNAIATAFGKGSQASATAIAEAIAKGGHAQAEALAEAVSAGGQAEASAAAQAIADLTGSANAIRACR